MLRLAVLNYTRMRAPVRGMGQKCDIFVLILVIMIIITVIIRIIIVVITMW